MSSNPIFEKQIQQWVTVDNQIKLLNDKLKDLRETKSTLNENIQQYAQRNNLKNTTVQITDGKLRFVDTKVSNALTFRYIEKSLGEIIQHPEQVKRIMDHLKEKRDVKVVSEIKRYSINN